MSRYAALLAVAVLCGCSQAPAPVDVGTSPAEAGQHAVSSTSSAESRLTQVVLDVPGMH